MQRILLLVTDLEIGGTPTIVRELAIRLSRGGKAHVHVACLAPAGPVARQIRDAGVKVTALGSRAAYDVRILPRLSRLVREEKFDVILSFLIHANATAALLAPFHGEIRWMQSIQTTQPEPRWHWALQRLIHPAADAIVVPTESVAEVAQRWCAIPPGKIVVIPNAVDPVDFADAHPPACIFERRPVPIGFIGRLDPVKRIGDLLEAVQRLDELVHLHIFGEGAARPAIEMCISALRVEEDVTLHGAIRRPQEALQQVGILVLPSDAEGFGLVLIEAMAAGVNVVATDVAGIRDVVRDGQTGLLVAPRDPAALAEAIRRMVSDAFLRQRLAACGLAEVRARFTWEIVVRKYEGLLGVA